MRNTTIKTKQNATIYTKKKIPNKLKKLYIKNKKKTMGKKSMEKYNEKGQLRKRKDYIDIR